MAAGDLVFVDTETTGLNPTLHQAYEVAWALSDGEVRRLPLPHTLENADPESLAVGGYVERGFTPEYYCSPEQVNQLIDDLTGATLVGSNPDHTAAGDVMAARAVYSALRDIGAGRRVA